MPALLELALEANSNAASRQTTAVGIPPTRVSAASRVPFMGHARLSRRTGRAFCAIEVLVQAAFTKKYAKSVSYF